MLIAMTKALDRAVRAQTAAQEEAAAETEVEEAEASVDGEEPIEASTPEGE